MTDRTLFQAASISKPVFALGVLRLADTGRVKLEANVNDYLTTWKVPDSPLTRQAPVTLRALLSHTAGINGQGFRGYEPEAALPTLNQILDGTRRLTTARSGSILRQERDFAIPVAGTSWRRRRCRT